MSSSYTLDIKSIIAGETDPAKITSKVEAALAADKAVQDAFSGIDVGGARFVLPQNAAKEAFDALIAGEDIKAVAARHGQYKPQDKSVVIGSTDRATEVANFKNGRQVDEFPDTVEYAGRRIPMSDPIGWLGFFDLKMAKEGKTGLQPEDKEHLKIVLDSAYPLRKQ